MYDGYAVRTVSRTGQEWTSFGEMTVVAKPSMTILRRNFMTLQTTMWSFSRMMGRGDPLLEEEVSCFSDGRTTNYMYV